MSSLGAGLPECAQAGSLGGGFPSAPYDLNRQRAVASTFNRLASSVPPTARQVLTTLLCATSAGDGPDTWAEVTVAAISLHDGTRDAMNTAHLLSEALDEGGTQAHHGLLLASTTRLGIPHDVDDWRSIAALLAAQPDPNTTPRGAVR